MNNSERANWFGILWILLGLLQSVLVILVLGGYSEFLVLLFAVTLLVFPLRYLLMEEVLGLHLQAWIRWTAIATLIASLFAIGSIFIAVIGLLFCCFYANNTSFSMSLLLCSFYPIFRLTLLWIQEQQIPKLKTTSWLIDNAFGPITMWLALAFFISNTWHPAITTFVTVVAVAFSELMTANSLITIKKSEEKRKVEEM